MLYFLLLFSASLRVLVKYKMPIFVPPWNTHTAHRWLLCLHKGTCSSSCLYLFSLGHPYSLIQHFIFDSMSLREAFFISVCFENRPPYHHPRYDSLEIFGGGKKKPPVFSWTFFPMETLKEKKKPMKYYLVKCFLLPGHVLKLKYVL